MVHNIISFLIASFFVCLSPALGFCQQYQLGHRLVARTTLHAGDDERVVEIASEGTKPPVVNRRDWLCGQSALVSSAFLGSRAYADEATSVSPRKVGANKSVVILGANGGTGRECVSAVLASGRPCYATTRSGSFNYDEDNTSSLLSRNNPKLFQDQADVTNLQGLANLVDKINSSAGQNSIGAMIFAASASAKGKTPGVNDAYAVDQLGVINAAKCCIQTNIPRLVIVSSGAVTQPNSATYKLLNFVGNGIMEAKIKGEDEVRDLYRNKQVFESGLGYTIVRPGGLTMEPQLGPAYLEVNQGDDKCGRLSRADVAGICIASLDIESCFDVTFECYLKDTAKPVGSVGLSNILKSTDPTSYKSGFEGTGNTWDELLGGLKRDFTM